MTSQQAFEKAYPMPAGATRRGEAYRYAATANPHDMLYHAEHATRWETWQRAVEVMVL